jgi:hypothetical protein
MIVEAGTVSYSARRQVNRLGRQAVNLICAGSMRVVSPNTLRSLTRERLIDHRHVVVSTELPIAVTRTG